MPPRPTAAVTGAFSYTGRYLTRRLLDAGYNVINLSGNPRPEAVASFTEEERTHRLSSVPLDFSQTCPSFSASASSATSLPAALEGVDVLFCTYWIRFAVDGDSHTKAADRVAGLFDLAKRVGVGKVVFSSHTQATESSPFTYIAGKARAAAALRAAGVPYGIVRPCGIFGDTPLESILMNNAAWVLRRSPLFLLAGDGAHQFQPIHVRDMADLMFDVGTGGGVADERDACGPDVPTARELFSAIGKAVGSPAAVVPSGLPTRVVTKLTRPIDWYTGDILLDADDLDLLCSGLTVANDPDDPAIAARRSVFKWIDEVAPGLGTEYVSSMQRYYGQKPG
jgi:NADH dehydrogenase